ncbi:Creatinase/aminopeptidase [Aureobasidium sp. EXF-8845]|nr:Creatinase/aminopeptidase [Aureobasidium sp. EXF-8845]KAI4858401.1 Creatinase/aminopeptidase [Aureobasidium sp. EXF-8846]
MQSMNTKNENSAIQSSVHRRHFCRATKLWLAAGIAALYLLSTVKPSGSSSRFDRVQQCSIDNLHKDLYFLENARPIEAQEFLDRRDNLAKALHVSGVDGFVLEPGYTFQYYANISQPQWEPWEVSQLRSCFVFYRDTDNFQPEERPFLMIVQPSVNNSTREVKAKTTFLSPHFEEGRVRMLGIPSEGELDIIVWEEHWNPYSTLKDGLFPDKNATLMVDEEIRDFLVRGLDANGFKTVGLGGEVEAVRQTKTPAEIELLRAVNTGTIEGIRAMQPCLEPGLTENQVIQILDNTLKTIGFDLFFDIVLFDSNAALPHGGFATGDKVLTHETMVLIDAGYHYLGYSSDVCRSFFIDPPKNTLLRRLFRQPVPEIQDKKLHAEKLKVWDIVLEAQTEAGKMFVSNGTAASVDIAARKVIDDAGYKGTFTHRLGHGIGIKAHESPYLNKGNHETLLRAGMTFTAEPGIYLENKFGVRHEDIYLVKENGHAEVISGKRAVSPYEP